LFSGELESGRYDPLLPVEVKEICAFFFEVSFNKQYPPKILSRIGGVSGSVYVVAEGQTIRAAIVTADQVVTG
jgi:hypothetical protein